jgi:hypothetical protein
MQCKVHTERGTGVRIKSFIYSLRNDDGMTTAEYAVGTVAAAGLGGVLLKLLTSDAVRQMLLGLIQQAFNAIFN